MAGVKNNIVLIGMMGTGKSSAGKILAEMLGMYFLDLDGLLTFEYNMTIPEIFAAYGEDFFRELESSIVRRVYTYENVVIATGGGVILREENMRYLNRSGYIVLLNSDAQSIFERTRHDNSRPLMKSGNRLLNIKRLIKERDASYRKYADMIVNNSTLTPEETAEAVVRELEGYFADEDR